MGRDKDYTRERLNANIMVSSVLLQSSSSSRCPSPCRSASGRRQENQKLIRCCNNFICTHLYPLRTKVVKEDLKAVPFLIIFMSDS